MFFGTFLIVTVSGDNLERNILPIKFLLYKKVLGA